MARLNATGLPAASEGWIHGGRAWLRRVWLRPWMRADILDTALGRVLVLGTTGALLVLAIAWTTTLVTIVSGHDGLGVDFQQYLAHTSRWQESGQFYLPHQLAGPTTIADGDPLYPPVILWLLIPFTVLPAILWWAVPVAVIVGVLIYLRPAWRPVNRCARAMGRAADSARHHGRSASHLDRRCPRSGQPVTSSSPGSSHRVGQPRRSHRCRNANAYQCR